MPVIIALLALSVAAFVVLLFVPRRWESTLAALAGLLTTAAFVALIAMYAMGGRVAY